MKITEFWNILGISEEQSKKFDDSIALLSDNQKSLLKRKIEASIVEYGVQFPNPAKKPPTRKLKDFSELHFASVNRLISSFMKTNEEFHAETNRREEEDKQKKIETDAKDFEFKTRNMDHKEKVVCPHCQTTGGVYMMKGKEVIKTRVNSIAARVIGLGTNTERHVMKFTCANCEMDWKVED